MEKSEKILCVQPRLSEAERADLRERPEDIIQ